MDNPGILFGSWCRVSGGTIGVESWRPRAVQEARLKKIKELLEILSHSNGWDILWMEHPQGH